MPRIVNPPTMSRRNANNLQVAIRVPRIQSQLPRQPRAQRGRRRQGRGQMIPANARRGVAGNANRIISAAKAVMLKAIDRLANPRVHMGELMPRRTPIPGLQVASAKSLANFTPTTQYHLIILGNTYASIGYVSGTSTAATTAFTCADTTENVSFAAATVGTLNMSAGSLSVACGTGTDSASGFVTCGCIPAQFGAAAVAATLDPGDLINAPGAITLPMWDFLNTPRTGLYRKLTPAADSFYEPTVAAASDQSMVPFVLLNIPTGVLANTVFSVQAFKSYDFYPELIDQIIPGVESQASEAECQAAGYAQQILGADLSATYPFLASSASNGVAAALIYRLQQTTVDAFVGYLANYLRGVGGRGPNVPTVLDMV